MGRIRMPALTVSFLLLAAACGDSDAPVSTATSSAATTQGPAVSTSTTSVVSASTTIGVNSTRPPASASSTTAPVEGGVLVSAAAGGAVVSDDGLLRLVVPAGALDEDTMIGLTRMDLDVGLAGSVPTFALQPDGLAFSTPAAAVLDLDGLFGDDGGRPLGAVAILGASGSAVPRQTLTLLDGAATLVFEVPHFSFLMVLGGKTVFEIFPMEVDTGVGAVWEARLDVRDSPSLDGAVWTGEDNDLGIRVPAEGTELGYLFLQLLEGEVATISSGVVVTDGSFQIGPADVSPLLTFGERTLARATFECPTAGLGTYGFSGDASRSLLYRPLLRPRR